MKLKQGRLPGKPTCPQCGSILDAYSDVNNTGHKLWPGDYTFCAYCAAPLEWTGHGYARLTRDALVLARLRPDFAETEGLARYMREHRKK